MAQVRVEGDIQAPLEAVWALVSDFIEFLHVQGLPATGHGEGVGMTRTIPVGNQTLVERLESQDDVKHVTTYSMVSGPIPWRDYLGTIELTGPDEGPTHLSWTATFEPDPDAEQLGLKIMQRTFENGIRSLQNHFASESSNTG